MDGLALELSSQDFANGDGTDFNDYLLWSKEVATPRGGAIAAAPRRKQAISGKDIGNIGAPAGLASSKYYRMEKLVMRVFMN